ncbi:MAG: hypothetical protein ABW148_06055 [Sedimenticola sp.]
MDIVKNDPEYISLMKEFKRCRAEVKSCENVIHANPCNYKAEQFEKWMIKLRDEMYEWASKADQLVIELSQLRKEIEERARIQEQIDERKDHELDLMRKREGILDKEMELERMRRVNNQADTKEMQSFYDRMKDEL